MAPPTNFQEWAAHWLPYLALRAGVLLALSAPLAAALLAARSFLHKRAARLLRRLAARRRLGGGDERRAWELSVLLFEEIWEGAGSLALWAACCALVLAGANA